MEITIVGEKVTLLSISADDLPKLWELIYNEETPEWKKWDAPYFPLIRKSLQEYRDSIKTAGSYDSIAKLGIWAESGKLIGTVGFYWEHKESNWLEVGISIYRSEYWFKGYGREALKLWITYLFETMSLVRVGLTTWSGNIRMMKCAESLGMLQEARLRKCRYWNGEYYDSMRYGILREEWNAVE